MIETINTLNGPQLRPSEELDPRVLSRLNNTGKILEIDKTALQLHLQVPRNRDPAKLLKATFDQHSVHLVTQYQESTLQIEDVTLWGRLRGLFDRSTDLQEGKYFTGELLLDSGDVWRVRFDPSDKRKARELWSTPIYLTGRALYYRAASPKIIVSEFGPDEPRDYVAYRRNTVASDPHVAVGKLARIVTLGDERAGGGGAALSAGAGLPRPAIPGRRPGRAGPARRRGC